MKRERPPMPPLAVRVQVAERQFVDGYHCLPTEDEKEGLSKKQYLNFLLMCVFDDDHPVVALDHDPALILRPYNARIKNVAARYTPHAHDPDALIYREKADHQQKTTGRKPGALRTVTTKGSDIGIKTKFARLEAKKTRKKRTRIVPRGFGAPRKMKIPSRPFPKRGK